MSGGESLEARFGKIDAMLKDPKSEINTDCLLVRFFPFPRRVGIKIIEVLYTN